LAASRSQAQRLIASVYQQLICAHGRRGA